MRSGNLPQLLPTTMGNIEDYRSGRILDNIGKALLTIGRSSSGPGDTPESAHVKDKIREFEPVVVSIEMALAAVQSAGTIAIGERVCRPLHPGTEFTESIFLDELAAAMIDTGRARAADTGAAELVLKSFPGNPLVMSKVSGSYLEICASSPESCVFWLAEKNGLRCFKRRHP